MLSGELSLEKVLYQFHFDYLGFLTFFIPLILGLFFFFYWKIYLKKPGFETKLNSGHIGNKGAKVFVLFGGSFSILMFILLATTNIYGYFNLKHMIDTNHIKKVEGYVEKYHPMPYDGHEDEHFTINGVYFGYSDFQVTNGYNNSASHGGVITHNGQHLLIKYYKDSLDDNNVIVYIAQLSP